MITAARGAALGLAPVLAAVLAASCATPPPAPSMAPPANAQSAPESTRSETLARARLVALWQAAHLDGFDYLRTFQRQSADPSGWIQATYFIGLTVLADETGDAELADALIRHGEQLDWRLGGRPRHADDDALGRVWIWAAARVDGAEREARLTPVRARFDAVLAAPSAVALDFDERPGDRACQARWCWSDALFMAPPAWFMLSRLTGDARYADHAHAEYQAAVARLFDAEEALFYRDSRFVGQTGPAGRKVFWSRGNGWTYAGLAAVIDSLDATDPRRAYYVDLFRRMSDAVIRLQGAQGYWPASLLDPSDVAETSGTGFFVYGLAWGVNNGLLTAPEHRAAADRGWRALDRAVDADGRLGWVQQVGYAPEEVLASDTQLYGSGAYLMAAAEMSKRHDW